MPSGTHSNVAAVLVRKRLSTELKPAALPPKKTGLMMFRKPVEVDSPSASVQANLGIFSSANTPSSEQPAPKEADTFGGATQAESSSSKGIPDRQTAKKKYGSNNPYVAVINRELRNVRLHGWPQVNKPSDSSEEVQDPVEAEKAAMQRTEKFVTAAITRIKTLKAIEANLPISEEEHHFLLQHEAFKNIPELLNYPDDYYKSALSELIVPHIQDIQRLRKHAIASYSRSTGLVATERMIITDETDRALGKSFLTENVPEFIRKLTHLEDILDRIHRNQAIEQSEREMLLQEPCLQDLFTFIQRYSNLIETEQTVKPEQGPAIPRVGTLG